MPAILSPLAKRQKGSQVQLMSSSGILHKGGMMLQSRESQVRREHMVEVFEQSIENLGPWKTTGDKGNTDDAV